MIFLAYESFNFHQGDTLDYLGIPGLHLAGSQGVVVIAICQALLMVIPVSTIHLAVLACLVISANIYFCDICLQMDVLDFSGVTWLEHKISDFQLGCIG